MAEKNPVKWPLHWQIGASLLLAVLMVAILKPTGLIDTGFGQTVQTISGYIGEIFINALKMIIVPLIVSSIISAVMHLGTGKNVTRLGLKTLLYYAASGAVAVLIGLFVVNVIAPGKVDPELATTLRNQGSETASAENLLDRVEGRDAGDIAEIFVRMFPPNIFDAAADNGQLLGVIVFSLLFGYFITRIEAEKRETMQRFWDSVLAVMMKLTDFIIRFAPIGVFGLVLPKLLEAPLDQVIGTAATFFFTVLIALALHFFLTMALILKFVGGINPLRHYREMTPVLLTAFSTASSSGTLPLTMDTVQDRAKVSGETSSFTLPLGATVNMDGTALYECVVVIFIAQLLTSATGAAFGIGEQLLVVVLALVTSIGVAGIPSASLVAITLILSVLGLPVEAIGVVWITDRILDMCRTAVNVFSDTVGAVVIAKTEGEQPYADDISPDPELPPAPSQA